MTSSLDRQIWHKALGVISDDVVHRDDTKS